MEVLSGMPWKPLFQREGVAIDPWRRPRSLRCVSWSAPHAGGQAPMKLLGKLCSSATKRVLGWLATTRVGDLRSSLGSGDSSSKP